jgi:hypothetical protein
LPDDGVGRVSIIAATRPGARRNVLARRTSQGGPDATGVGTIFSISDTRGSCAGRGAPHDARARTELDVAA